MRKIDSIKDPGLAAYVLDKHPRFYELCSIYGSPLDSVDIWKEGKNIAQTSAKLDIICQIEGHPMNERIF